MSWSDFIKCETCENEIHNKCQEEDGVTLDCMCCMVIK